MSKTTRVLSIAILVADTPVPRILETRGGYDKIYSEWLHKSLAAVPRHAWQDEYKLKLTPFDVVKEQSYPDENDIKEGSFDAIMITGSTSSAYADLPWTNKLATFIKHVAEDHPLVRIIGVCYGHQIIARALGGKVEVNQKGWEIGTYECKLTEQGRELLGYSQDDKLMKIQEVHRDIVTQVPDGFVNLASTEKTNYQGLAKRYPTDAPPLPSIAGTTAYMAFDVSDFQSDSSGPLPVRSAHVLSVQGHPEFDEEIVTSIIDVRTEMGIVTGSIRDEGLKRAKMSHDGLHLGINFLAMLGLEPKKNDVDPDLV